MVGAECCDIGPLRPGAALRPLPRFASEGTSAPRPPERTVPCGDLRCGPTPFASLGGRASAEVRLRASSLAWRLSVVSGVEPSSRGPLRFARGPGLRGGAPPGQLACVALERCERGGAIVAGAASLGGRASAEACLRASAVALCLSVVSGVEPWSRGPLRFARGRASAEACLRASAVALCLNVARSLANDRCDRWSDWAILRRGGPSPLVTFKRSAAVLDPEDPHGRSEAELPQGSCPPGSEPALN